ncbi:MAG: hypothetical protein EOO61_13825 [Hymenobacter sp.]|nr:MAG: hypothetical protein EOO61_13825 [Hymenobacter sp.]
MKEIEVAVHIYHNTNKEHGDTFLIRLADVPNENGFDSEYMKTEVIDEVSGLQGHGFLLPIMLTPHYHPRFEGIALFELAGYEQTNGGVVRGIATYKFETTAS